MKNIINGHLFVKYKWITLILSLLFTFSLGYGAQRLYFNSNYKVFFEKDNEQLVQFERLQDEFIKNDPIVYAVSKKDETSIFDKEFLNSVKWLTKEAWKLPKVTRVDSLSNFQYTKATEEELSVSDLIQTPQRMTQKEINKVKEIGLKEPFLANRIIRSDSLATGVVATLNINDEDPNEGVVVGAAALDLAKRFEKKFPQYKISTSGTAALNFAFADASQKDAQTIIPLMYFIILIIIFFSLKSFSATFSSLIIIIFSTVATLGLAGFLGFYFTSISSIVPTIVLTLAVADSVHILKTMLGFMNEGMKKEVAIQESLQVNARPVFLTSFTTIIGFLSLNLSEVPPYHDLGNMTAFGVSFAYLYSIITLPALISILPLKVRMKNHVNQTQDSFFTKLSQLVKNHSKIIISLTTCILILSLVLIPQLKFSDEPLKYFDNSMEFRQDTDFIVKNLTGVESIEISLPSKSGSVSDPLYLRELDLMKQHFEQRDDIVHIASLTDIVRRLNKSMNADNQEFYRVPESRELASQYLLLYELSLPKGLDLGNTLNLNKTASKMVFTLSETNSDKILELERSIRDYVSQKTTSIGSIYLGSVDLMFAHISKKNLEGMITGGAISFGLITLCLIIALGSFKYGLISIVTNIMPSIAAFGLWSLVIGKADLAVSVASSVTIGVIVDFTVHFLSKYSLLRKKEDVQTSIEKVYEKVGPPTLSTALVLAIGFAILSLSPFRLNWVLGALSSTMILFSVLFLFLVMPSLLRKIDLDR